ncbi:hypothetical protein IEQ34_002085 [Dendrobium chrysotoxum]|uniref:Uncharacterized protein n=1 Tax=Dendrobium chrysotoxum TaxID=161865 RepID=A0AAV7HL32_DENCH|nr:hypothetical protein IEQ34_002085 [Dendrobium chrysotoxum]
MQKIDKRISVQNLLKPIYDLVVLEFKNKLEKEHSSVLVRKNGIDDEDMIHWFSMDRKFVVEDAVTKLIKAIV